MEFSGVLRRDIECYFLDIINHGVNVHRLIFAFRYAVSFEDLAVCIGAG